MDSVRINVGGTIFLTSKETLKRYPGTLLAELDQHSNDFDVDENEYFYNRDPAVFACVLNMYRTHELHITKALCGNAVKLELAFWKISPSLISPCCWRTLHEVEEEYVIMGALEKDKIPKFDDEVSASRCRQWRRRLWEVLEYPSSSLVAKLWSYLTAAIILLASAIYCLDTVPDLRQFPENGTHEHLLYVYFKPRLGNRKLLHLFGGYNVDIYLIDLACLIFFTLELTARVMVCQNWRYFIRSFVTWIDVLAVLSGWSGLIYQEVFSMYTSAISFEGFLIIRSIYVVRLFRIIRLLQNNSNFRIILLAVRDCWKELFSLMLCLLILALIFGSVEFFCEERSDNFTSISVSIWWAIVTMTTVGYGDMYPTTYCGYVFASACAYIGVLALTLPVAVIATHFNDYYSINLWRMKSKRAGRK